MARNHQEVEAGGTGRGGQLRPAPTNPGGQITLRKAGPGPRASACAGSASSGPDTPWGDGHGAAALAENQPRPLALTASDFDEDGVVDLIGGYGDESGGVLALYRGNPAAPPFYPAAQGPAAGEETGGAPYFPQAQTFALNEAPELLVAGEVNRADGLADLCVGVAGAGGA